MPEFADWYLNRLETHGLENALTKLDAKIDSRRTGGIEEAPSEMLACRITLLIKGGKLDDAFAWLKEVVKVRKSHEDRRALLTAAHPLLLTSPRPRTETVVFLWQSWANLKDLDMCREVSEKFALLPRTSYQRFDASVSKLLRDESTALVGHLGIVHLRFAKEAWAECLPGLKVMAAASRPWSTHALDLINRIIRRVEGGDEHPLEFLWASVEIHLSAGQRRQAKEQFAEILEYDPDRCVGWLSEAVGSGAVTADEAESLGHHGIKELKTPRCPALRRYLFDLAIAREDGVEPARRHALALIRSALDPEEVWSDAERLEKLRSRSPDSLPVRTAWLEVCCRAGREADTETAAEDVFRDVPGQVVEIFGHWPGGVSTLPPKLAVARALALHELGKENESADELSGVLESGADPEILVDPLRRLVDLAPERGVYRLLLFRCLYRRKKEKEALEEMEVLLDSGSEEVLRLFEELDEIPFSIQARARSILLLVRACLDLGRRDDALDRLALLYKEDRELFRSGLAYALKWQNEWLQSTEQSRRLAGLLLMGNMADEAIHLLDGAATAVPNETADRASALAAVFDDGPVAESRAPGILQCKFRTMVRAGRLKSALHTALAMADIGMHEEAHGLLTSLYERPQIKSSVLPHLLASAVRIGSPPAEILAWARGVRDIGNIALTSECYDSLRARDEAEPFGNEGTELLGQLAVDLDRYREAADYFARLLSQGKRAPADAGLEGVVRDRPDMAEVRTRLVDSRREAGLPDEALTLLEAAPRRTDEIRAALERLVEFRPVHLRSWYVQASWMEELGEWDALVGLLDRLRHFEGVDLNLIDHTLHRLRAAGNPSGEALWLAREIARRLDNTEKEVAILFDLLGHGDEEVEKVFATMDDLRRAKPEDFNLIVSDVKLSATGGSLARVISAGRAALDEDVDPAVRVPAMEAMLEVVDRPEFDADRFFHQTLLDLGIATGEREVAETAYRRLLDLDADNPADRYQNAQNFLTKFGEDLTRLVDTVEALLDLFRPLETVAWVRKIEGWREPGPKKKKKGAEHATLPKARAFADRAAEMEPGELSVRQLASELAAESNDAEAALEHALGANTPANRGKILGQLREHGRRFGKDPRFDLASAVEVCEPSNALVTGAEHLGVVLDRDPDRCEEVWEIATRFAERESNSSPIQSVKARAAVLLAVRDSEMAQAAVADLRHLAELDHDRLEEALGGLETVLEHRPELLEGRFLREELLRALGRVDDAIAEARGVLKLVADPNDEYDARYRLADALEAKHGYEEAQAEWLRLQALGGVPEEAREEVPRRIRENFLARTHWQLENVPPEEALRCACAALAAGRPEEVLRALPPDAVPEDDTAIHWLALRGGALLSLERHEQLLGELRPHLGKIPIDPPLTPFEREFLFALGRSSLAVGERDWAFHCLERVARDAPAHRGVRRLLDHGYHRQASGQEPALEMTLPMEEVAHG